MPSGNRPRKGLTTEQKRLRAERIKKKKLKRKLRRIMMAVLAAVGVIALGIIIYCLIVMANASKAKEIVMDPTYEPGMTIPTKLKESESEYQETDPWADTDETEKAGDIDPSASGDSKDTDLTESAGGNASKRTENEEDQKLAGKLVSRNYWDDLSSLSNTSIPYGNEWDKKDAKTNLAEGIFWYENKYGKYHQLYRIKTTQKVIYLTFDEGYEYGYTPMILDTLKEKNVKAVFFITKEFLDGYPQYVERMINEGHVIGNHTCRHPSGGYPLYVDEYGIQSFIDDVSKLHQMVYDQFGYTMKLFRFPEGESSERLMAVLDNYGYTSVFWSYAHRDYVTDDQPSEEVTLDRCLSHLGCGSIYLLHAVSASNTAVLGDFIDQARALGYEFKQIPVDEVSAR